MKLNQRIMSVADLLEEQIALNTMIRPKWKKIGHSDYLSVDAYLTQLVIEMVELATDSDVVYKWWAKTTDKDPNTWNIKIEAIDALHFYLSGMYQVMQRKLDGNFDPAIYKEHFLGTDVMDLIDSSLTAQAPKMLRKEKELDYETFMSTLADLIKLREMNDDSIPPEHVKQLMYFFINQLMVSIRLTSLEVSAIFSAKCELNKIRSSSGYKEGKWQKVQDGVEDNQKLEELVTDFLEDQEMTLAALRRNVRNRFFQSTI